ncbi:NAD-dependent dihydropyrimidine dehydrogenase subunit PreA [Desulfosporosinus sp.]|uniref:NAD-dependent dihydropyrimidine dehydrogenase subunit PreA n=1 Tax=Desulfosporosinus sp. TaxID=157907 RepID=UPI0025C1A522|nr:NAD-dependent dihydropyrimidine dehydrogenase subunit PreA [Desulfosporosinus sp.]MBC2722786.1 NAD-dependent dihydropyrimidine dehydrogenase subunit PreA [Desulfosporosinus sp.]MBC2727008.1 NAD-dependent dihydropyrimidine dehydrogenase subunit PreA [Desulfosporosinus sp.]
MTVDLSVDFCGIKHENPFILAPSPSTDNLDLLIQAFEAGWAGAVLKTVAVDSRVVSRVFPMVTRVEQDAAFIGLQNIDLVSEHSVETIERNVRILKERFPTKVVIPSIMAFAKEDWQSLTKRFIAAGADIIECSIWHPHGTEWTLCTKVEEPVGTEQIASWVKEAAGDVPVIIKLSALDSDIIATAVAVERSGADGVSAINTIKSITGVNLDTLIPYPNIAGLSTYGGLSGPALKPIALRCTAEIAQKVDLDIAASGGITTWKDGAEFLLLGANTLQICTAVLRFGLGIIDEFKQGLEGWMREKGFQNLTEVIGKSLPYLVEHSRLPRGIQVVSTIHKELCNGCGVCLSACRAGGHQAIIWTDGFPQVEADKCIGCGICRAMCFLKAITLIRPSRAKVHV